MEMRILIFLLMQILHFMLTHFIIRKLIFFPRRFRSLLGGRIYIKLTSAPIHFLISFFTFVYSRIED